MNLTMLGTGNALVTECYNTCFVIEENKQYFMVDGGGGNTILQQLPYNPCEEIYAKGCEWLLHEAFCLYSQADIFKPYEKHHSTVKDACELAEKLGVQNLLLYHTEDSNIQNRKELYKEEGGRNTFLETFIYQMIWKHWK